MNTKNRLDMKNARAHGLFVFIRFSLLFLFKTHMVTDSLLSLCSTARWTRIPFLSTSCTLSGTLSLRWEKPLSVYTFRLTGLLWLTTQICSIVTCKEVVIHFLFFCPFFSTVSTNMVGSKPHHIYRLYVPCVEFPHVGFLRFWLHCLWYVPLTSLLSPLSVEWVNVVWSFSHSRLCSTIESLPIV